MFISSYVLVNAGFSFAVFFAASELALIAVAVVSGFEYVAAVGEPVE